MKEEKKQLKAKKRLAQRQARNKKRKEIQQVVSNPSAQENILALKQETSLLISDMSTTLDFKRGTSFSPENKTTSSIPSKQQHQKITQTENIQTKAPLLFAKKNALVQNSPPKAQKIATDGSLTVKVTEPMLSHNLVSSKSEVQVKEPKSSHTVNFNQLTDKLTQCMVTETEPNYPLNKPQEPLIVKSKKRSLKSTHFEIQKNITAKPFSVYRQYIVNLFQDKLAQQHLSCTIHHAEIYGLLPPTLLGELAKVCADSSYTVFWQHKLTECQKNPDFFGIGHYLAILLVPLCQVPLVMSRVDYGNMAEQIVASFCQHYEGHITSGERLFLNNEVKAQIMIYLDAFNQFTYAITPPHYIIVPQQVFIVPQPVFIPVYYSAQRTHQAATSVTNEAQSHRATFKGDI